MCVLCDRLTSFFLLMFSLFRHSIKAEMDIASSHGIIVIVICFRSLLGKWVQNDINSPLPASQGRPFPFTATLGEARILLLSQRLRIVTKESSCAVNPAPQKIF